MDYYYLNNGGTGFGVENIAVGNLGSVSVALIKNQGDGSTIAVGDGVIGQSKNVNSCEFLEIRCSLEWYSFMV